MTEVAADRQSPRLVKKSDKLSKTGGGYLLFIVKYDVTLYDSI